MKIYRLFNIIFIVEKNLVEVQTDSKGSVGINLVNNYRNSRMKIRICLILKEPKCESYNKCNIIKVNKIKNAANSTVNKYNIAWCTLFS